MLVRGDLFHGRYLIKSVLGVGGMGAVYLALDQSNNQLVALKILKREISNNETVVKRFQNEGLIGQKLSYDYIVKIYDHTVTQEGDYYLTMEYIEGGSIRDLIIEDGKKKALPFDKALQILKEIAKPIAYLHDKKIIHRDLKPENVLVTKSNKVKLSDFGVALSLEDTQRITATQSGAIGTLQYLSPEQWGDKNIDHRADIYAFGIIAFELITGHVPYEYSSYHSIEKALQDGSVPQISGKNGIPHWFQDFIEKCLEKDRDKRFQSMHEVINILSDNEDSIHLPRGLLKIARSARKIKPGIRSAFIAIVLSFLCLYLTSPLHAIKGSGLLGKSLEMKILDAWFLVRGRLPPPKDVVIVSVDEQTYHRLNIPKGSALPRELMAKMLLNLKGYNPRKIALDFQYLSLNNPDSDQQLAQAIKESGAYLGKFQELTQTFTNSKYERQIKWHTSHPYFANMAQGSYFGSLQKHSGVVRRFAQDMSAQKNYPAIADFIFDGLQLPNRLPDFREFINYYGPSGTISNISFLDLLDKSSNIQADKLNNKIILVGKQFFIKDPEDRSDIHLIPNNLELWGVEVHATAIANILEKNWIKRLDYYNELLLILMSSALICFLILQSDLLFASVLSGTLLILWPLTSYNLYINCKFFPGTTIVLIAILSLLPRMVIYIKEEKRRKRLFSTSS